jgi:hypothetical protein
MAAATVTLEPGLAIAAYVKFKYVCDGTPSDTYIDCGFVPSKVEIWASEDRDTGAFWTNDMADDTAISEAGADISSEGITPIPHSNASHHGFMIGTNANIQEASKTFSGIAYR